MQPVLQSPEHHMLGKQQRVSKITIFTDAQAAIKRMQTLEVGPGQVFAGIRRVCRTEIDCPVGIQENRWQNEKADE